MRLAVRDVANRFPTAIISGRSRDKVMQNREYAHRRLNRFNPGNGKFLFSFWSIGLNLQVYDFVRLENVYYAGSHGMDIAVVNLPSMEGDTECESKVSSIALLKSTHRFILEYLKLKLNVCILLCNMQIVGGQEVVLCQPAKEYFPEIQKVGYELTCILLISFIILI